MDRLTTKLHKETSKIRLKAGERHDLRARLVSYMEYHPLSENVAALPVSRSRASKLSPYVDHYIFIPFSSWQMRSALGALALFVIVGIPLSAEQTVPGDVLYPVKVRVNEEVRGGFSFTSYQKVAWETHRVERRIAEARLLAREGKLTEAVEQQITETVKEHTENAKKELAVLREKDADGAAVAEVVVASALEVQSAVLETELASAGAETESGEQIKELATLVSDTQATLIPTTADAPTLTTYDRFNAEVEETTTRARDLYASLANTVTPEEDADIKRRLEDIDRKITLAHEHYNASTTGGAIQELKDILSDAQKVIAFMTDIDVRTSVALEELVPKQLTHEERVELVRIAREEIAKNVSLIEVRRASSTDPDLYAKVDVSLEEIKEYVNEIDMGLGEGGSLEAAEQAEVLATALVRDLVILTDFLGTPEIPPVVDQSASTTEATAGSTTATNETTGEVAGESDIQTSH